MLFCVNDCITCSECLKLILIRNGKLLANFGRDFSQTRNIFSAFELFMSLDISRFSQPHKLKTVQHFLLVMYEHRALN